MKPQNNRRKALGSRVAALLQSVQEHSQYDLHNDLVAVETYLEDNFSSSERDMVAELREDVQERAEFLATSGDLDMNSNQEEIHRICRRVTLFMENPDKRVQVIRHVGVT